MLQLYSWHKQGINIEVSINISSNHLLSGEFLTQLSEALSKYPTLDPHWLQVEVLENSAFGELTKIHNVLQTCQNSLGITVALDDFGTGYSSLAHLRNLPINVIKIDQSFVKELLDDPEDYAIIDGVIGLASSFNRKVIAEGVETYEHGLMLIVMGCEQAQGYGISRPMPAAEFPHWIGNYVPNPDWIYCGGKYISTKERKAKLLTLIMNRWKSQFIANIQSSPEDIERWPIMDSNECPCGFKIKRVTEKQLFKQEDLKRLDEAHDKMHNHARAIHLKYQAGDIEGARSDSLEKFQTTFDEFSLIVTDLKN